MDSPYNFSIIFHIGVKMKIRKNVSILFWMTAKQRRPILFLMTRKDVCVQGTLKVINVVDVIPLTQSTAKVVYG